VSTRKPPCADISELNLGTNDSILFPEGQDKLLHFQITMRPKEGIYRHDLLRCRPRTNWGPFLYLPRLLLACQRWCGLLCPAVPAEADMRVAGPTPQL